MYTNSFREIHAFAKYVKYLSVFHSHAKKKRICVKCEIHLAKRFDQIISIEYIGGYNKIILFF